MKAAIFDVDGTLLDSMGLWKNIGSDYLRALGITPREGLSEVLKTMSMHQAAAYYQDEYGLTLSAAEIIADVTVMIERYYKDEVQLKAGVFNFLTLLHRKGIRMCIATASGAALVESALQRLEVSRFFPRIFTCESVGHGKDKPLIYEEASAFLQTEKSATIVFEDALYAMKTAKAAGFRVAAVYDKYECEQNEVQALADYYMRDFDEAAAVLFS